MASDMLPIPPASRSPEGRKDEGGKPQNSPTEHSEPQDVAERGQTANIKQNTTNKGFFQGRRVK